MTSEEQQNDMSMEDILSSIKDILENDSQNQPGEATQPTEVKNSVPEPKPQTEEDDDVFDLSKSMIIEDTPQELPHTEMDETGPDFDLALDKDDEPLLSPDDIEIPDFENIEADNNIGLITPQSQEETPAATTDDTEVAQPVNEVAQPLNSESNISDSPENENASDALSLNIDDILQNASETISEDINAPKIPEEEEPAQEPEIKLPEAEAVYPEIDVTSEPIFEESFSDSIEYEPEPSNAVEENIQADVPTISPNDQPAEQVSSQPEAAPEEKPAENVEAKPDATDVSADIINNFAKMFAEQAQEHPAELHQEIPTDVSVVGNGNKTIEQVVEGVIQNIVAASVSAEMTKNVDIVAYAQKEIHAQTRAWLEANLPAIVEAAVQKEIERVMAKVGR